MQLSENNFEQFKFNKNFGFITQSQLILTNTKKQNKIYIESIKRVNLIKKRVFYTNVLFFTIAVCTAIAAYIYEHNLVKIIAILVSIVSLFFAIIHKFYFYTITIKLKNNEYFALKTSQLNKESIKEFYYEIVRKIKKKDGLNYMSNAHSA